LKQDFAIKLMIALGLVVAALFGALGSLAQGVAVLAGAGLGLFNYHWLYQGAVRFFEAAQSGAVRGGSWMILAVLRLGFLAGALVLLTKMGLEPVGLAAGLSVPVVSQVVWTSRRAFGRTRARSSA
jgi:hypothetical protein